MPQSPGRGFIKVNKRKTSATDSNQPQRQTHPRRKQPPLLGVHFLAGPPTFSSLPDQCQSHQQK